MGGRPSDCVFVRRRVVTLSTAAAGAEAVLRFTAGFAVPGVSVFFVVLAMVLRLSPG